MLQGARRRLEGIHSEKSNFNEKAEQEVTTRDKYRVSGRYTTVRLCTCCLRKFLGPVGLLEREFNRFITKTGVETITRIPLVFLHINILSADHRKNQYFRKELKNFRELNCYNKIKVVKLMSKIKSIQ